jgi:hypothetical protein
MKTANHTRGKHSLTRETFREGYKRAEIKLYARMDRA